MPSLTLIGIGSRLRSDDSVGLRLVEALADEEGLAVALWEDRDALDIAAGLLELEGPALVVDAAEMRSPPGSSRVFGLDDARLVEGARGLSTHGLGLADGLRIATELGLSMPVTLFGVQPASLELGESLSPVLEERFPGLADELRRAVRAASWVAVEMRLRGVVQGVGLRPALVRAATSAGLGGWVQNRSGSVLLRVEGARGRVEAWLDRLPEHLPSQARLDAVERLHEEGLDAVCTFAVLPSEADLDAERAIPPDLRACDACVREVFDTQDRRHGYAFTTCVDCGPRYTVVLETPYDRERTTLARFPLCSRCASEYGDPDDRRFHAESMACPRCGPHLRALGPRGEPLQGDPLRLARAALAAGQLVALLGIGGFQLAVDGRSDAAVQRLRDAKHRPRRAFAAMVVDLAHAMELAEVSAEEAAVLASPSAPIVLLRARDEAVRRRLAPESDRVGLLLPTSPLHHLLARPLPGDPTPPLPLLLLTSGNRAGEPIATTLEEALVSLDFAELFLDHDREVALRCDDSVACLTSVGPQVWRRARGYAPEAIRLARPLEGVVLACGAELKNTVAVGERDRVVLSPHIGDLGTPEALEAAEELARRLPEQLGLRPTRVAVDLHPDLRASRMGEALAASWGVPIVRVQHHHAHAAACMAEHGLEEALALVYDGVGLGSDGALWGGELLHVHPQGFERLGTFAPAPLPGGDVATLHPIRQAVGRSLASGVEPRGVEAMALRAWRQQVERGVNAPSTHAVGRLFDAVAALLGLAPERVEWEGQAAQRLEVAASSWAGRVPSLEMPPEVVGELAVIRWEPMWRALSASALPPAALARGFHFALVEASLALVERGLERRGVLPVVLSGGVFHNQLLCDGVLEGLRRRGVAARVHLRVPPGDGGVALGQAVVAGRGA